MFTPYERPSKKGVEEAKQSLVKAIEAKKFAKSTSNIQKAWRRFEALKQVSELMQKKTLSKILDLKKLKPILGDKLKYLPVKVLIDLNRNCKSSNDPILVFELKD